MGFEFRCQTCGEIHKGMPGFGADAPLSYYAIPEAERASRCELSSDECVIDRASFFIRGCLEIPVLGADEPLIWGVWISLSEQSFNRYHETYESPVAGEGFFGWVCNEIKLYSYNKPRASDVIVQPSNSRAGRTASG